MTKYNCTVIFDASASTTIEADSPEDAAIQAENKLEGSQHLCHQCAHQLETGDSLGVHIYNEECTEQLLDTTYKPPQRQWVGLTDEEMEEVRKQAVDLFVQEVKTTGKGRNEPIKFGRLVEAKLKEKNL